MQGSQDPLEFLANMIVAGLEKAQTDRTKGVYFVDVQRGVKDAHMGMLPPPTELHLAFLLAFRKNKLYSTRDFTKYSIVPLEGYKTCQQWQDECFKGYEYDDHFVFKNKGAPTLNLKKHIELLLSPVGEKDEEIKEFEAKLAEWGPLFLDGEDVETVLFSSFPRCGNTMTRKYLESVLGITTGSDNHTLMSLITVGCSLPGFKGEFIVDNRTWINKTHYPIVLPMAAVQKGYKALVCIRDVYDLSYSAFNLIYTLTHNKTLTEESFEKLRKEWEEFVDLGYDGVMSWIKFWRDTAKNETIPVHFFMFEELKEFTKETLSGILSFLFDGKDLKGTYLEQRLERAVADSSSGVLYKPRQGKVAHDTSRFSEEIRKRVDYPESDNPYFFRVSDPTSKFFFWPAEEQVPERINYQTHNAQVLEKLRKGEFKKNTITANAPGTGFKMVCMEPSYFAKVQKSQLLCHLQDRE